MPLYTVKPSEEERFMKFISKNFSEGSIAEFTYEDFLKDLNYTPKAKFLWFKFPESDKELEVLTSFTRALMQGGEIFNVYGIGVRARIWKPRLYGVQSAWYLTSQEWCGK